MRSVVAAAILIALMVLVIMSFAPPELVGVRSGLRSFAGAVTAIALLAVTLVGGWVWLRDRRKKDD